MLARGSPWRQAAPAGAPRLRLAARARARAVDDDPVAWGAGRAGAGDDALGDAVVPGAEIPPGPAPHAARATAAPANARRIGLRGAGVAMEETLAPISSGCNNHDGAGRRTDRGRRGRIGGVDGVTVRAEGRVPANGIELAWESFGERHCSPIVLVMGLGTQMIAWPDEMCEELAGLGHYVVRFDNRDVGASTHLDGVPPPRLRDLLRRRPPPYGIGDMAEDVVGLLDGLDLDAVHLVGASLGGFIAQTVAVEHPERVRTLTLMMTSTGSRLVGQPKPRIYADLLRRRVVCDRNSAGSAAVETFQVIGSQGYALDEEYLRDVAGRSWDRGVDPDGYQRQLAAAVTQPNRRRSLRHFRAPTLVMHGLHDPLVSPSGGLAIAKAIPGARFVGFSGMGHDLPRVLWPEIVREIAALTAEESTAR